MIRQKLTIGFVAAAFTLSLAPAVWAQAGSRPNTTGSSSGSATPRGGGGSSSSGGSSSAGSSSSSGSSSSPSASAPRSGSSSSGARVRERAPQRPSERAVPRGSNAAARGSNSSATPGSDRVTGGRSRAEVPAYSRPRDNRNVTGTAVERRSDLPGNGNGGAIYVPGIYYGYDPFYSNYYGSYYSRYGYYPYSRYWVPGYGFGLGYFAYDPFMFGGYDYYGGGYGGYGGGYSSGGYSSQYDVGNLRLKVKPNEAQVYVDGYFVGPVDSFDGIFQKLGIEAGAHRIELRAEGYETVQFEVLITPGETVTYKGEMKPIRP
jgi:PEGA domain